MKVALFSPWPQQRSGIADYAYTLAQALVDKGVEVEVFTAANLPTSLARCVIHSLATEPDARPRRGALPVFQLGNNAAFHSFQVGALAQIGGLVHLHDTVLHHLHLDRTLAVGDGDYWQDVQFWYGPEIAHACAQLIELNSPPWSNAAVTAIPLFEPYLQFADAVLVHSQSALGTIARRMPSLRAYCIPQCYPLKMPPPRPPQASKRPLRLGMFGLVEPHKRVDQILDAMAGLHRRGIDVRLDICGPLGATMTGLVERIGRLGLSSCVKLRGHLEHSAFVAEIAGVDVCVNLRDPTMGETSAVVTQAMQLGTPVIVSDTGWYAELPDFALKVPVGEGAVDALVGHLSRLDSDRGLLASLAEATRRYASIALDFDAVVARYVEILDEVAASRAKRQAVDDALYRDVAVALADIGLSDAPAQREIAEEIMGTLRSCL
jgi:glycosyltransferase involved in cell wall biosynthesis